jgi:hypothetical protein
MSYSLAIATPSLRGTSVLEPGGAITIGGDHHADIQVPGAHIAPRHFVLHTLGSTITIDAIEPMFVNNRAVAAGTTDVIAAERVRIHAGEASFTLSRSKKGVAAPGAVRMVSWRASHAGPVMDALLLAFAGPRYALLDAARDRLVYQIVRGSKWPSICLFPPEHEVRLAREAPHLLRLPDVASTRRGAAGALAPLRNGYGKSWGIFLVSRAGHERLAASLRHLLIVRDDDGGPLYFRFYDPRVLRAFLPLATPYQTSLFFDAADLILLEDEDPDTAIQASARTML